MAKRLLNLATQEHEWVLSEKEYDAFVRRSDWLGCLEAAGVDNWSGMEYAIQLRAGNEDEDEEY